MEFRLILLASRIAERAMDIRIRKPWNMKYIVNRFWSRSGGSETRKMNR